MKRILLFRELMYPLKTKSWCMRFWFAQKEFSMELQDVEGVLDHVRSDVDSAVVTRAKEVEEVVLDTLNEYYCGDNLTALEILSNATRKGTVSYFDW